MLEKPPAATFADFERMVTGVRVAGIACQVGFQSFGSHAVPAIRALVDSGAIGAVRGIGAAGAWVRDDAYYHRAPWAGRRRIGTADVVDGVLTNPSPTPSPPRSNSPAAGRPTTWRPSRPSCSAPMT